jgi:hypothetical protein
MKIGAFTAMALFASGALLGPTLAEEGQQACMSDAFAICGQFIPDRDRVATCLYSNVARVSEPCRQVLGRHDRTKATPARMTITH